jgi:hypothetical protein
MYVMYILCIHIRPVQTYRAKSLLTLNALRMHVLYVRTVLFCVSYLDFVGSLLPPDDGLGGGNGQLLGHHCVEREGVLEHLHKATHSGADRG